VDNEPDISQQGDIPRVLLPPDYEKSRRKYTSEWQRHKHLVISPHPRRLDSAILSPNLKRCSVSILLKRMHQQRFLHTTSD
jgi:hypothetical protein